MIKCTILTKNTYPRLKKYGSIHKSNNFNFIQNNVVKAMGDEEKATEHINLKVAGQDGSVVQFKIKKVLFSKILEI